MNWQRVALNVLMTGGTSFLAVSEATEKISVIIVTVMVAVCSNLLGLYQPQPHKEGA